MIYILGVLITAVATTGRVYSLASSLASVLCFQLFLYRTALYLQRL